MKQSPLLPSEEQGEFGLKLQTDIILLCIIDYIFLLGKTQEPVKQSPLLVRSKESLDLSFRQTDRLTDIILLCIIAYIYSQVRHRNQWSSHQC